MTRGWALFLALATCWLIHRVNVTARAYLDQDLHSPTRDDGVWAHVNFLLTGSVCDPPEVVLDLEPEGVLDLEPVDASPSITQDGDSQYCKVTTPPEILEWVQRMLDRGQPESAIITAGCHKFGEPRITMVIAIREVKEQSE